MKEKVHSIYRRVEEFVLKVKRKISVASKLMCGFGMVLLLLTIISVFSVLQIMKINSNYAHLIDDRFTKLVQVQEIKEEVIKQSNAIRGYLLTGEQLYLDHYNESIETYQDTLEAFSTSVNSDKGRKLLVELENAQQEYEARLTEAVAFKKSNNREAYIDLIQNEIRDGIARFTETADNLVLFQDEILDKVVAEETERTNTVKMTVIMISSAAIILGLVLALLISRQISIPVVKVSNAMKRMATGDLTIEKIKVKNRDEIGELASSLHSMVKDLRSVVKQVANSSSHVAASSEELSAASEQSNSAAEQVAIISQKSANGSEAQIQEFNMATTSMQEVVSGIEHISKASEDMLDSTVDALDTSNKGEAAIEKVFHQMNAIHYSVEQTTDIIRSLDEHSRNISSIISLITDISDQTNLLALNAAIEAARAGEHGKGFAVVAEEVRKLAEQSRHSADQVIKTIVLIQEETEKAVQLMEKDSQQVQLGMTDTSKARDSFNDVGNAIKAVTNKVQEVSTSVEEINALTVQLMGNMQQVNEIAQSGQENAQESSAAAEEQLATTEEISASAQSLAQLAEQLQSVISRFKI